MGKPKNRSLETISVKCCACDLKNAVKIGEDFEHRTSEDFDVAGRGSRFA